MVNSDAVSDHPLQHRQNGTADNGHIQKTRCVSSQRAKFGYSQTEDCREHDRVEQSDAQDGPHGNMAGGRHRYENQQRCENRAQAQQRSRFESSQQSGAEETTYHRATPIERHKPGGRLGREMGDIRLTQVIHEETSDGNLCAHVGEDGNGAQDEVRMFPDGIICLGTALEGSSVDLRQLKAANQNRQQDQGNSDDAVWLLDGGRFLYAISMQSLRCQLVQLCDSQRRCRQYQQTAYFGSNRCAQRVERLSQIKTT